MKTFRIRIAMGNAEMQNHHNLASVLHGVAARLDQGAQSGSIRDVNGNTVGRFWHDREDDRPEEENR
jgi:hypothetical protein